MRLTSGTLAVLGGAVAFVSAQSAHAAFSFTDNLVSGGSTLNGTSAPSGNKTSYDVASNKGATASLNPGDLKVSITTSSGYDEVQALFSSGALGLTSVGDQIEAKVVFTATANVLQNSGSYSFLGLYNSGGSAPLSNLQNSGLATTATTATTGGVAGWNGYEGQISAVSGNGHKVYTRAAQSSANNSNQDLVGNGVSGGYNTPAAVGLGATVAATNTPTIGQQYTQDLLITLSDVGTLSITNTLYSGVGTGGSVVGTSSGTATGANLLATAFDGISFGMRHTVTPSATGTYDVNSVSVTSNVDPVAAPEPATLAAFTGLGGLAFARRRRQR